MNTAWRKFFTGFFATIILGLIATGFTVGFIVILTTFGPIPAVTFAVVVIAIFAGLMNASDSKEDRS